MVKIKPEKILGSEADMGKSAKRLTVFGIGAKFYISKKTNWGLSAL